MSFSEFIHFFINGRKHWYGIVQNILLLIFLLSIQSVLVPALIPNIDNLYFLFSFFLMSLGRYSFLFLSSPGQTNLLVLLILFYWVVFSCFQFHLFRYFIILFLLFTLDIICYFLFSSFLKWKLVSLI